MNPTKLSPIFAIMILSQSMLPLGLQLIPKLFAISGYIVGTMILFVFAFISNITVYFILENYTNDLTCSDTQQTSESPMMSPPVTPKTKLNYLSAHSDSILIIQGITISLWHLKKFQQAYSNYKEKQNFYENLILFVIGTTSIFYLSISKRIATFKIFSLISAIYIGILFVSFIIISILIYENKKIYHEPNFNKNESYADEKYQNRDWFYALGICFSIYSFHQNLIRALNELKDKESKNLFKISSIFIFTVTVIYSIIGWCSIFNSKMNSSHDDIINFYIVETSVFYIYLCGGVCSQKIKYIGNILGNFGWMLLVYCSLPFHIQQTRNSCINIFNTARKEYDKSIRISNNIIFLLTGIILGLLICLSFIPDLNLSLIMIIIPLASLLNYIIPFFKFVFPFVNKCNNILHVLLTCVCIVSILTFGVWIWKMDLSFN